MNTDMIRSELNAKIALESEKNTYKTVLENTAIDMEKLRIDIDTGHIEDPQEIVKALYDLLAEVYKSAFNLDEVREILWKASGAN